MKGRIKREDLDHLLRLVQTGLPRSHASHDAGTDADGVEPSDILAPDNALWNANHEFWLDKLKSDTDGTWTDAQYASAAAIINAAEYQHVVFSDIANALTRGLSESWQSRVPVDKESPDHFLSRADHVIAPMFEETVDLVDATTGRVHKVQLAALADLPEPDRSSGHKGDGGDVTSKPNSTAPQSTGEIALSPKQVNLGELTGSRAREAGYVSFNQARGELFAQCGLSALLPYSDWDDFRDRNHLPDDLITDLKAAYPDGFGALDLWVGGLAETPAVGDLGPTIAAAVSAEIAHLQHGRAHPHLDMLAGTHLRSEITTQSWADIVARNTGWEHSAHEMHFGPDQAIRHSAHNVIFGTDGDDVLIGTNANDIIFGGAGDDKLDGGHGADILVGGPGNDTYVVDNVRDHIIEKVDGGAQDTVLTDLNAFVLDDGAPAAPATAPASSETTTPLVAEDQTDTGAEQAVAVTSKAPPSEPPDSGLPEFGGTDSGLPDFGRAANVENLSYIGHGSFYGRGNSSNNVIVGGEGDDHLWGGGGDDVLYGRGGDDALFGGSGDDVLFAGFGNDRLDGGPGDDVLYLSSGTEHSEQGADLAQLDAYGHDTIVLKPGFGNDVVSGFDANQCGSQGHDRLDVSAYTSLTPDSIGTEIQIIGTGPHTIITINGDSITLLDVNANTIGKDDFIFS